MYNSDTEMLFPSRVMPHLKKLRGKKWRQLVERVMQKDPADLDHLAFVLMMIRLDGCEACHADSYRAMRGCTQCAKMSVRRFRGEDQELLDMFAQARKDIQAYLADRTDNPI